MSLTTILSELWRFMKENWLKILAGAIIISVLAVLSSFFVPNLMGQSPEEVVEDEERIEQLSMENVQESRDYLATIYGQAPAEFEMFVQLQDGSTFGNSFIFDEYFTSPAVVDEIERETGVDYSQTLAHEQKLQLYKTSQYRGSIAGIRNTSSNVITIRVQATESSEENLLLAEAFAEQILENEIPFIQDLSVTLMRAPAIGEQLVEEDLQMVSAPEALGIISPVESESRSVLLYAIAGFIIGLLITAVVLFILQLFKKKINYAFQYSWDFNDHHFIMIKDADREQLNNLLLIPEADKQLVVAQTSPFTKELWKNNPQIEHTAALSRRALEKEQVEEIVLLVESKETDKKWYNDQYRLAEMSESQLTILQVIDR